MVWLSRSTSGRGSYPQLPSNMGFGLVLVLVVSVTSQNRSSSRSKVLLVLERVVGDHDGWGGVGTIYTSNLGKAKGGSFQKRGSL